MNCLTESELQSYLDKEMDDLKHQHTENHLKTCAECMAAFKRLKENKANVFSLLDELNRFEKPVSIPVFEPANSKLRKLPIFKIAVIAASLLLLIGFGFILQKQKVIQNQNLNIVKASLEMTRNADPNQMYHSRQMTVVITDASGNVVQTYTAD
jgi:hypothetical protein